MAIGGLLLAWIFFIYPRRKVPSDRFQVTQQSLEFVKQLCLGYQEITKKPPGSIEDLRRTFLEPEPTEVVPTRVSTMLMDGWGSPIQLNVRGSRAEVVSSGPNRTTGDSDDLSLLFDLP